MLWLAHLFLNILKKARARNGNKVYLKAFLSWQFIKSFETAGQS